MIQEIELTTDQEDIINKVTDWYFTWKDIQPYIVIGGYAGTGKTTLIKHLVIAIQNHQSRDINIAFCSYTGKATSILKQKLGQIKEEDCVCTLHSLMYIPLFQTDHATKKQTIIGWQKRDFLKTNFSLIIVDESSMLNKEIWQDLLSYKIPVVFIGDHGQLPPVSGAFNLMENPHYTLTTIHRQSLENPLIQLSKSVREIGYIQHGFYNDNIFKMSWLDPNCRTIYNSITDWDTNIINLCAFNKSRVAINNMIREKESYKLKTPYPGERVVCLKNNHKLGIMNGMVGTLLWCLPSKVKNIFEATILFDGEEDPIACYMSANYFGKDIYEYEKYSKKYQTVLQINKIHSVEHADFGYCLSVHKAQGSEWKKVILFEQRTRKWDDDFYKKWLYTAITRAQEKLFIITDFWE